MRLNLVLVALAGANCARPASNPRMLPVAADAAEKTRVSYVERAFFCADAYRGPGGVCYATLAECRIAGPIMTRAGTPLGECREQHAAACYSSTDVLTGETRLRCYPTMDFCNVAAAEARNSSDEAGTTSCSVVRSRPGFARFWCLTVTRGLATSTSCSRESDECQQTRVQFLEAHGNDAQVGTCQPAQTAFCYDRRIPGQEVMFEFCTSTEASCETARANAVSTRAAREDGVGCGSR